MSKSRCQDLGLPKRNHPKPDELKRSFNINHVPEGDKARAQRAVDQRKITVTVAKGKPFLS